ncbi:uncharacterized protein [Clytia hemisphaerica]|uniref:F-box domain-containing protein n=2 Tax=Clytia hemisphaerica TaxID=252671 RepID=A0A7M5UKX2_9CNID
MMSLNVLPTELLKMVISYLGKRDAKSLAVASRKMREIALEKIWSKPIYQKSKGLRFLKMISRFPIDQIRVKDFRCKMEEVIETVSSLKRLNLDLSSKCVFRTPLDLIRFKFPIVAHTKALKIDSESKFGLLLVALETGFVKELIVDHHSKNLRWSPELLKMLVSKVYISEISVNALRFTDENVEEFCQIFSSLRNCQVFFPEEKAWEQDRIDDEDLTPSRLVKSKKDRTKNKFTITDIETFARYDVKISSMAGSNNMLNLDSKYNKDISKLLKFVPALKRLQYLHSFKLREDGEPFKWDHSKFDQLSDLPIRRIRTNMLIISKENVGNIVDTLSKMKSLQHLHILWNRFKLTPEEFALFQNLRVKIVNLTALELTKENVPKFRQIMNEMKIEKINSSLPVKKRNKLGIRFRQFGPGAMFWSI